MILLLDYFSVVLWSVVFHELGHYAYFYFVLKKRVAIVFKYHILSNWKGHKLTVGTIKDYKGLTRSALVGVYVTGILTGFIPIIITSVFMWPFLFLVFPYLMGCRADLSKCLRGNKKNE